MSAFREVNVDVSLKRLLDAEAHAAEMARQADVSRERQVQDAMDEARVEEQRFEARIPGIHESFVSKAEQRAETTIKELERRYHEHQEQVRQEAESRQADALEAAFALIIDADAE
ncbi:MAG: ATPase [Gammaproteobacteria bacterium]